MADLLKTGELKDRPLNPTVGTEGCIAWRSNNPPAQLKAYVKIVKQVGRSIR